MKDKQTFNEQVTLELYMAAQNWMARYTCTCMPCSNAPCKELCEAVIEVRDMTRKELELYRKEVD